MTASLYYANTFENVAVTSTDLVVEYTASYPERARYYALFARADRSGYDMPDRGVLFELQTGQSLPDDVTPPDFYEKGEGLMTWRNVVTDNGSYDLEPAVGVVTFRVCSVRAAEKAVGDTGSGGGAMRAPGPAPSRSRCCSLFRSPCDSRRSHGRGTGRTPRRSTHRVDGDDSNDAHGSDRKRFRNFAAFGAAATLLLGFAAAATRRRGQ
jgi:hypothetical protein